MGVDQHHPLALDLRTLLLRLRTQHPQLEQFVACMLKLVPQLKEGRQHLRLELGPSR